MVQDDPAPAAVLLDLSLPRSMQKYLLPRLPLCQHRCNRTEKRILMLADSIARSAEFNI